MLKICNRRSQCCVLKTLHQQISPEEAKTSSGVLLNGSSSHTEARRDTWIKCSWACAAPNCSRANASKTSRNAPGCNAPAARTTALVARPSA